MLLISPTTPPYLDFSDAPPMLAAVERHMLSLISSQAVDVSGSMHSAAHASAYHLGVGGQRVRARLALQASTATGLTDSDAVCLAATAELLHNASLIHDDIQDGDEHRRGEPAVWARYGVSTAICAGDLLLSAAYASLCKVKNSSALPELIALVHARTSVAVDGQCADLSSREAFTTKINQSEADALTRSTISAALSRYKAIAVAKSGALLSLPIELALVLSGNAVASPVAQRAAEAFSIAYQIHDDLNDLVSDTKSDGAADTFNIIHVFKTAQVQCDPNSEPPAANAVRLALAQLDVTEQLAATLPNGSGALLTHYSAQLRRALLSHH